MMQLLSCCKNLFQKAISCYKERKYFPENKFNYTKTFKNIRIEKWDADSCCSLLML